MFLKTFLTFLCTCGMLLSLSNDRGSQIMPTEKITLILNMENQKSLPRNFRMTSETYVLEKSSSNSTPPSTYGIHELHASASGQFSQESLSKIIETISSDKILLLDLRQESHGFVNGIAISWYGENDWGNKDKTLEEILLDEKQRLQKTIEDEYILAYQKNSDINNNTPLLIHVREAYSEADLVKNLGIQYIRIPLTDYLKPSNKNVDLFVEIIKKHILNQKSSDYWIHLHCAAGRGRSTTLMSMYDMMRNASHVSFHDILARQAMIGGKDLTQPFDSSDWRYSHHFERLDFLVDFYNYCLENPHFEQSWSSWLTHKIKMTPS